MNRIGIIAFCYWLFISVSMAEPPPAQILSSHTNGLQAFSIEMAIDGDTLVIGAPYSGNTLTGMVYIYRRQGGNWVLEQQLPPPVALPVFGFFGDSVGVSGDTLIVGVGNEAGGPSQSYIFKRDTAGWQLQQIVPTAGQVAIDGDTA